MKRQWAPHECVQCGSPAYIPFGMSPKCTNRDCMHHDDKTRIENAIEEYKASDPITEPTPIDGLFKDFCYGCHRPADFARWVHPDKNVSAWCPLCGEANYWDERDIQVIYTPSPMHGQYLNAAGGVLRLTRRLGESDDEYRERLQKAYGGRP